MIIYLKLHCNTTLYSYTLYLSKNTALILLSQFEQLNRIDEYKSDDTYTYVKSCKYKYVIND